MTEAEVGAMLPKAKECLELSTQEAGRDKENSFSRGFRGSMAPGAP